MTIQELSDLVRYHADLYFNQGKPEISDAEFDSMVDELRRLDPNNAALLEVGAPTYGKKVTHPKLMGSLTKANDWAGIEKWAAQAPNKLVVLTPKIDGIAVRLEYRDGKLHLAATRGDGTTGQDVTDNVRHIKSIPNDLGSKWTGELRGEIYMKKSVWESLGEGANPRNAAAGALMSKDPVSTGKKNLDFYCYDVIDSTSFNSEESKLDFIAGHLSKLIMAVPHWTLNVGQTLKDLLADWENTQRAQLDYQIDGMVLAFNETETLEELGMNGRCPRGKLAFKFKPEQKEAQVVRIDWFVGRQGKLTPVAVITPTRLAGTTVENVTLHNLANVKTLDLHIGDTVLIEKAGDIIPQVVRVTQRSATTNPVDVVPTKCPTCGSTVEVNSVHLWCMNPACPAKLVRSVLHYLECLEVLGIGEGIAEKLCASGMVKSLPDLYYLDQDAVAGLLGGARMGEKVYLAIMQKNEVELAQFLDGLGIDGLGTSTGKQFAKHFKTLDAVLAADYSGFIGLEGIGQVTAQKIADGLKAMAPVIEGLRKAIEVKDVAVKTGALTGMSFCLTGAMSKGRSAIEKEIEAAGGECKSCGRGLTYLVQADPASMSGKSEKAKKLGIKIISEDELYKLMGK